MVMSGAAGYGAEEGFAGKCVTAGPAPDISSH